MPDRTSQCFKPLRSRIAPVAAVMLVLTIVPNATWSQTPPPSPSPGTPAPAQQAAPDQPAPEPGAPIPAPVPPAHENSGLINEIGKMFGKLPTFKSTSETIDDLNERAKGATKDATDTLTHLTKPLMVTGRMICPVSANGAPDCKTASDKLCQTKGFKEGKSLTADSAETCSAKVLIPGRTRKPDDCRTDTFVTRALCQ
jgi:hypothetical protein